MTQVAYLDLRDRSRRLYNDVVRKSLKAAGITYQENSREWGYRIMVDEKDSLTAAKIILGISHHNPKYPKS